MKLPTIQYVLPGGVANKVFADGAALVRVTLGWITTAEGVLTEMQEGQDRIPWTHLAARNTAVEAIKAGRFMSDDDKAKLVAYVEATPYYGDEE